MKLEDVSRLDAAAAQGHSPRGSALRSGMTLAPLRAVADSLAH